MRKYLVWKDGHSVELSPITYREFMALNLWVGSSDMAWEAWLRRNHFVEADTFNDQALDEAEFLLNENNHSLSELYFQVNEEDRDLWESYGELKLRNFTKVSRLFSETTLCYYLKPDYIQPENR